MINFFRSKIRKVLEWFLYEMSGAKPSPIKNHKNYSIEEENFLNFNIYKAENGGKVIQINHYDSHNNHRRSLYIISDKDNFNEELGYIITKEMLSI